MTDRDLQNMFTAWLEEVIKNAKIDYIRRKAARDRKIKPVGQWEQKEESYEQDFRLTPSDEFDFAEERLADSFASLPLLKRNILKMIFIEDMSPSEIADALNCSVNYVYLQKHRALQKLKEMLTEGGESGD